MKHLSLLFSGIVALIVLWPDAHAVINAPGTPIVVDCDNYVAGQARNCGEQTTIVSSNSRSVRNLQPRAIAGSAANDAIDPTTMSNWSLGLQTNATVTRNASNIVFTRTTANDGSNARATASMTYGPVASDTDLSVCFTVSAFNANTVGSYNGSLSVTSSNISGTDDITVTQNGTYCRILAVDSASDTVDLSIGFGVDGDDTRTNSITVSQVSVSPTTDSLPNEYVDIRMRRGTGSIGINGAVFNYSKDVTYNTSTGLTSFVTPSSPSNSSSVRSVLSITDSYGAFISNGLWKIFMTLDEGVTPSYSMVMNNVAGRQLANTDPTTSTQLQEMLTAYNDENTNDASPGICMIRQGSNDITLGNRSAAEIETSLINHINWCQDNGITYKIINTIAPKWCDADADGIPDDPALDTDAPTCSHWDATKEATRIDYNSRLVTLAANDSSIYLADEAAVLDANSDNILDNSTDFIHPSSTGPGYGLASTLYHNVINAIITLAETVQTSGVEAVITASRTECNSPCTVVFSADKTTAQGLDSHGVWSQLSYYWDFDTDESDTYGSLYDQTYTYVAGDTSFEVGHVPMSTKTFLCDVGTCTYNVGMRAQNATGDFDDDFQTLTVRSESTAWSAANTICVSNTLNVSADWTTFDKGCPLGATKQSTIPLPDEFNNKLVLFRRGDVFPTSDFYQINTEIYRFYHMMGQSNYKLANFGNVADPFPDLNAAINMNLASYGGGTTQATLTQIDDTITDADVAANGWSTNVYFEGLKIHGFTHQESFSHVGLHDIDIDQESSNLFAGFWSLPDGIRCTDHPTFLNCSNVPFPKGAYLSKVNIVGSTLSETNNMSLNVGGIGCSMTNFIGIVDTQMSKPGEHNIRVMGWYRFNIMRSNIRGNHQTSIRSKLSIRICVDDDLFQEQWEARTDLPANWQDDVMNSDGSMRTRSDTYTGTNDDYLHVSRYFSASGNTLGERDFFTVDDNGGAFGTGINRTWPNDYIFAQDYILSNNIINRETDNSNSRIDMNGYYGTCVNNVYNFGASCSIPNSSLIPAFHYSTFRVDPTPTPSPLAPGAI